MGTISSDHHPLYPCLPLLDFLLFQLSPAWLPSQHTREEASKRRGGRAEERTLGGGRRQLRGRLCAHNRGDDLER